MDLPILPLPDPGLNVGWKPSLDRPFAVLQYETGKLLRGTAIGGGRWSLYDLDTLGASSRTGRRLVNPLT